MVFMAIWNVIGNFFKKSATATDKDKSVICDGVNTIGAAYQRQYPDNLPANLKNIFDKYRGAVGSIGFKLKDQFGEVDLNNLEFQTNLFVPSFQEALKSYLILLKEVITALSTSKNKNIPRQIFKDLQKEQMTLQRMISALENYPKKKYLPLALDQFDILTAQLNLKLRDITVERIKEVMSGSVTSEVDTNTCKDIASLMQQLNILAEQLKEIYDPEAQEHGIIMSSFRLHPKIMLVEDWQIISEGEFKPIKEPSLDSQQLATPEMIPAKDTPTATVKQLVTHKVTPIKIAPTSTVGTNLPTNLTSESIDALLDELLNEKEEIAKPSVVEPKETITGIKTATKDVPSLEELQKIKLELEEKEREMQSRYENLKKDMESGKDITTELADFKLYCEVLREEFRKAEELIPPLTVRISTMDENRFKAYCSEHGNMLSFWYEKLERQFKPQKEKNFSVEQQRLEAIFKQREQKRSEYFGQYSGLVDGILIFNANNVADNLNKMINIADIRNAIIKASDLLKALAQNYMQVANAKTDKTKELLFVSGYIRSVGEREKAAATTEMSQKDSAGERANGEKMPDASVSDAIDFLKTSSLLTQKNFFEKLNERVMLLNSLADALDEEMQSNPSSKEYLNSTVMQFVKHILKKKNAAIPPLISDGGKKITLEQALQENATTDVLIARHEKLGNRSAVNDIKGEKLSFKKAMEDTRYDLYDNMMRVVNELQFLSKTNEQLSIIDAVNYEREGIKHVVDSLGKFNADMAKRRDLCQEIINPFLRNFLLENPELLGDTIEEFERYVGVLNVAMVNGLSDEGLKNILASVQLELTDKEFNKANIYNKGLAIIAAKGVDGVQEFKDFLSINKLEFPDDRMATILEQIKQVQINSLRQELSDLAVLGRKRLSNKITSWHADLISIKRGYEVSEKIVKQALHLSNIWPDYSYLDTVLDAKKITMNLEGAHSELIKQFRDKVEEVTGLPLAINDIKNKIDLIGLDVISELAKLKDEVNPQTNAYSKLNTLLESLFESKQTYDVLVRKLEDAKNFIALSQENFINFPQEWSLITKLQENIKNANLNITALTNDLAETKAKLADIVAAINNYPLIKSNKFYTLGELDKKKIKIPMQFKELLDDVANSIKTTKPQWGAFCEALALDSTKDILKNNHDFAAEAINIERSLVDQFTDEITVIFYDDFSKITEQEFADPSGFNNKARCPNIVAADKRFNSLIDFVRTDILRDTDLNSSIMRFSFWLQVADKCFEKGNFAAMQAIMLAFAKPELYGLLYTTADGDEPTAFLNSLPLKLQQKFKMLQDLTASGDYRDLRKEFENRLQNNSFALLPLNIFKRDVMNIKEGSTLALVDTSTFKNMLTKVEESKKSYENYSIKSNGVSWLVTNLRAMEFYNEKEFFGEQTKKTKEIRKQFDSVTRKAEKTLSLMSKEEKLAPTVGMVSSKLQEAWVKLKTAALQFKDGNIDNFAIYVSIYIQALTPPYVVSSAMDVSGLSKSAKNYFDKYQKLMQEISSAYSKLAEAEKEEIGYMFFGRLSLLQYVSRFTEQTISAVAVSADAKLKENLDVREGSYESVAIDEINAGKFDNDSKLANLFIQAGIHNLKPEDVKVCFEKAKRNEQLQQISNPVLKEIMFKSSVKFSEQDRKKVNDILNELRGDKISAIELFNNELKSIQGNNFFVTPKQFASIQGYEKLILLNQKFVDKTVNFSELNAYLTKKPLMAYDLAKDLAKSVLPPPIMRLVNSVAKAIGKKIGVNKVLPPVQIMANQFLAKIDDIAFFYQNIDTLKEMALAKKVDIKYLGQVDQELIKFLSQGNIFKLEQNIHKLSKYRVQEFISNFLDGFINACEYQVNSCDKLSKDFKTEPKLLTKVAQAFYDLNETLKLIKQVKEKYNANFEGSYSSKNLSNLEDRMDKLVSLMEVQLEHGSQSLQVQKTLSKNIDIKQNILPEEDEKQSFKPKGPFE